VIRTSAKSLGSPVSGDVRPIMATPATLQATCTSTRHAHRPAWVPAVLTAAVVVAIALFTAGSALAGTELFTYSTAAHTYDAPARLSSPDTAATGARGSPSGPEAASWGSPASARDHGVAADSEAAAVNGVPKTSPNFKPPTNAPQLPPSDIPAGWRVREMPPTVDCPNGYWRLEKPMGNGGWQGIDPSTMKPGTNPETHVPFPGDD